MYDPDPDGTGIPFDINALAKAKGLQVYDTALPLGWYNDVYVRTGLWPQNYGFVWCYDKFKVWGAPTPLTPQAKVLLKWYDSLTNNAQPK
jgi:hypothetical protein